MTKKRLLIFLGFAFPGVLDVAIGALVVLVMGELFGYAVRPPHLLLGGPLGVLPDFDLLYLYLYAHKRGRSFTSHRTLLTHRPLVMLPLFSALGFVGGGVFWAVTAPACLAWHYLHDTESKWIPFGSGTVEWLWPLVKACGTTVTPPKEPPNALQWLRRVWLTPTTRSLGELLAATYFLLVIGDSLGWTTLALPLLAVCWVVVIVTWREAEKCTWE